MQLLQSLRRTAPNSLGDLVGVQFPLKQQEVNACHIYCDPAPDEREKLHIEEDLPFSGPAHRQSGKRELGALTNPTCTILPIADRSEKTFGLIN
jgi:hypothetical protein